jgi:hypothetical protein
LYYDNQQQKHTSPGFIKDGDELTFIVLHDAFNPFESRSHLSTTTFGYVGRKTRPESLSWKTICPDMRSVLKESLTNGLVQQVQQWHAGMLPQESRFHEAYWLAANNRPLSGLLNRASPEGQEPTVVFKKPSSPAPEATGIADYDDVVTTDEFIEDELEPSNDSMEIALEESNNVRTELLGTDKSMTSSDGE